MTSTQITCAPSAKRRSPDRKTGKPARTRCLVIGDGSPHSTRIALQSSASLRQRGEKGYDTDMIYQKAEWRSCSK